MAKEIDLPRRDKELAGRSSGKLYRKLVDAFQKVKQGFDDQGARSDKIMDYWDCYNCKLNQNQFYNGNAAIYVPIIRNAVTARKTRFLNQLFPASGRYIDATSMDGGVPHAIVALLENYIERTQFRTQVMAALLRNGDVEGHYNLYVDWTQTERHVVSRETRESKIDIPGMPQPIEFGAEMEPIVDIVPETIFDAYPEFDVLHDTDVLVLPVTAKSIDDALRQGGTVTVIRRWTKDTLKSLMNKGELMRRPTEQLMEMSLREDIPKSTDKAMIDAAGIKGEGKYFQVYEMFKVLETDEGDRLCSALYGGYELILSCRRIKFWNDRCPLLSVPQEKVAGSFKGASVIGAGCDTLQYHANDSVNQGADAATYSMLPIVLTDPASNPRTSTMILNLAAIWECDPKSTQFAQFPPLWQQAIPIVQADTQLVFQTMGVNPAMLPQQTGRPGAKRNQAEVALEQTVDLLTTAEACSVVEQGILTPSQEMIVDYDHQFRDDDVTVRMYGEIGIAAKMESVPPQQNRTRLQFVWFGVEQARNAQQMQQQIAALNVGKTFAADLMKAGYVYDPAPVIEHAFGNIFGWRMGRQIIKDIRSQLAVDPETENTMLEEGFDVAVHPMDNPQQHIPSHMDSLRKGDPTGMKRAHIQKHMAVMQLMAGQMLRQGQPGGGGPPQPGGGGGPQPGSQPAGPKLVRGPPGAIHPDQMPAAGAVAAPRKM